MADALEYEEEFIVQATPTAKRYTRVSVDDDGPPVSTGPGPDVKNVDSAVQMGPAEIKGQMDEPVSVQQLNNAPTAKGGSVTDVANTTQSVAQQPPTAAEKSDQQKVVSSVETAALRDNEQSAVPVKPAAANKPKVASSQRPPGASNAKPGHTKAIKGNNQISKKTMYPNTSQSPKPQSIPASVIEQAAMIARSYGVQAYITRVDNLPKNFSPSRVSPSVVGMGAPSSGRGQG